MIRSGIRKRLRLEKDTRLSFDAVLLHVHDHASRNRIAHSPDKVAMVVLCNL
jgi:hypothetical protein